MSRRYEDPADFRQALLARLRSVAAERAVSVQNLQLKLLIERLLARLFAAPDPPWLLKGGFAMELRYRPHARTTRDVDLTVEQPGSGGRSERLRRIRAELQAAAAIDLGDHLEFRVAEARRELPGAAPRFPSRCGWPEDPSGASRSTWGSAIQSATRPRLS